MKPLRLESIEQIHSLIGRPPPAHPLVAVIAASWQEPLRLSIPVIGRPIASGLYVLSLKRGDECHAEFGRQVHDGQAGIVVFASPGQTITPVGGQSELTHEGEGWTVVFHPDLVQGGALAEQMHRFRFFGYSAREALHVTGEERDRLTSVVRQLERESSVAPDAFAPDVLSAQLHLLLTYCQRAYARQFEVRARAGGAVAERLDRHLDACFTKSMSARKGLPTVKSCARALGYSPDYLSDLLRAETGAGAREHIHRAFVEAAKARLLSPEATVSDVAYALGFEHPPQFSRLFKQKTGQAPGAWRRASEMRDRSPKPVRR